MIDKVPEEKPGEPRPYRVLALVRGETLSKVRDMAEDEVPVWPELLKREFLMALTVIVILLAASLFFDAPLEQIANPTQTPNPAKAPWYFAGLQELLVYFDPWIAGVMLPALIIFGLMAIPYLDPNREGSGEYSFKKRKATVSVFTFGLFLWFLLILIGVFCRGPNWAWFWPWETWTTARVSSGVAKVLPTWLGLTLLAAYFGGGFLLAHVFRKRLFRPLDAVRRVIVVGLLLLMLAVPLKIFLRLLFDIKYVLKTPWFNL